jgi:U3 small nucleolar RNA-associated protein 21
MAGIDSFGYYSGRTYPLNCISFWLIFPQERNRPKEAPKAPEKAPFFLPSLLNNSGPESAIENSGNDADVGLLAKSAEAERLRISKLQNGENPGSPQSIFTRSLASGHQSGNFDSFIDHLKSLSPAKADLEIRSLDPRVRDGHSELADFVAALTYRLKSKKDFEMVNAWMAVFLKIHADTVSLSSNRDEPQYRLLQGNLAAWAHEQEQEGKRLAELVGYCRGVVGFLRSAR